MRSPRSPDPFTSASRRARLCRQTGTPPIIVRAGRMDGLLAVRAEVARSTLTRSSHRTGSMPLTVLLAKYLCLSLLWR